MENTQKPTFNAFDVLVIIIVIAIAVTGFWFFGRDNKGTTSRGVNIEYKVEFDNITAECIDDSKIGDIVKDEIRKQTIGTVIKIEYEPQSKITYDYSDINNLKAVKTIVPGLYKLTLTVKAEANSGDFAFLVNGADIKAGKAMTLQTTNFAGEGYCTSVTVKE